MKADGNRSPSAARVEALRALMRDAGVDAWIVPSEDAHQSEYVAACDQRRAFLTGFTGSAGVAAVTADEARCWTDGRYFLQASKELDPAVWTMMKANEDEALEKWLASRMCGGGSVGVFDQTMSLAFFERLKEELANMGASQHCQVKAMSVSLVDQVWGSSRPSPPLSTVFVHDQRFAGVSTADKIARVRAFLDGNDSKAEGGNTADALVVTALDEVAWLLNLRGSDIDFNPVFWAYVLVTRDRVILYVDQARLANGVAEYLGSQGVTLRPYQAVLDDLRSDLMSKKTVAIHPSSCNMALVNALTAGPTSKVLRRKVSVIAVPKALKNPTEVEGMRQCHLRDGTAVVRFFAWLESELRSGRGPTECEAADVLEQMRSSGEHFVSLSFETISAAGANAAIIHYRPQVETSARITADTVYLCDSGAQYRDGTTDVTRTLHIGSPTQREKECYTRVLKGHIGIDTCIFPEGTTGHTLDVLARKALWDVGLDFKHGTGHGVGCFLNVHEGPHLISYRSSASESPIQAGMTVTNEPGYYEDGHFGIRIENVLVVHRVVDQNFLRFEHVTFVPLEPNLIDVNLLTPLEIQWVNEYHAECRTKLGPLLSSDFRAQDWLIRKTKALTSAPVTHN